MVQNIIESYLKMNYRITNGSISYGAETIIEEINFEIKGKQKVAIVGRNGAGKTTLLKAIINNEMLSEGIGEDKFNIYKEGNPQIGYLDQIGFEDDSISMLDEILKQYKDIIELEHKMEALVQKMQLESTEETAKEYSKLRDRYEFLDGYTYKKEYETAIDKFGFSKEDRYKPLKDFSGGQRTKIAFIKLLLRKPDILILDEPTNHLDIETIEWLEDYLKNYPKAVLIVSHDRMFLNKIVDKVYEIEYGAITEYVGDYDSFEKNKRINYEKQLRDFEYQQKEIKRLTAIIEKFRYKASKAKMAQSKLTYLEKMQKIEEPNKYDLKTFKVNFEIKTQSGKEVLDVENLTIGYDKPLSTVSFKLYKGDRLGIIGQNGIGKSTLLKTIVGNVKPISGTYGLGHNVEVGYFDQQMLGLDMSKTIFDDFYDEFPELTVTEIRNCLAAFMFYGEDVFKKIDTLSGGERVRLSLAKILKHAPNFLILDEPTNHMDIIGKENLENILSAYEGTILFVSHDRFFVKKLANCILEFKDGNVNYFDYGYDNYLEKRNSVYQSIGELENKKLDEKNNLSENKSVKKTWQNPLKDKDKCEKKIKKIEDEISKIEEEIDSLKQELLKEEVYTDYLKVEEIQNTIKEFESSLEENMFLWEEENNNLEEISKLIK